MVATIKHYDSITIIVDVIMLDPAEAGLDAEDAFRSGLVNQVVQDDRVCRVVSAKSNIGFIVLINLIFLDVPGRCVYEQYALPIIAEYLVVHNFYLGTI